MAEEVEQELEGEDDGEAEVGRVQGPLEDSRRTVSLVELVRFQLRLEYGNAEILLKAISAWIMWMTQLGKGRHWHSSGANRDDKKRGGSLEPARIVQVAGAILRDCEF